MFLKNYEERSLSLVIYTFCFKSILIGFDKFFTLKGDQNTLDYYQDILLNRQHYFINMKRKQENSTFQGLYAFEQSLYSENFCEIGTKIPSFFYGLSLSSCKSLLYGTWNDGLNDGLNTILELILQKKSYFVQNNNDPTLLTAYLHSDQFVEFIISTIGIFNPSFRYLSKIAGENYWDSLSNKKNLLYLEFALFFVLLLLVLVLNIISTFKMQKNLKQFVFLINHFPKYIYTNAEIKELLNKIGNII